MMQGNGRLHTTFVCALVACFASFFIDAPVSHAASSATSTTPSKEWNVKRSPTNRHFGSETFKEGPGDEDILKVFLVRNGRLYEDKTWREVTVGTYDIDYEWLKDQKSDEYKLWTIFSQFADKKFVSKNVQNFVTFRDQDTSILGLTWRWYRKEPSWAVAINVNGANYSNEKWLQETVITLLHEYAHMVTLSKSQIKYGYKLEGCIDFHYQTGVGCPLKKSYVRSFVTNFWDAKDLAHAAKVATAKDDAKGDIVRRYYDAHSSDFVSVYAATSPTEDMAETFVDFVLRRKPTTSATELDKKILFFYTYPELVKMRSDIRKSIQQYFVTS